MRSAAPTGDGRPDDDTQVTAVPPRQRSEEGSTDSTAIRIVGLIGADRPSRVINARTPRRAEAEPPPEPPAPRRGWLDLAVCGGFALVAALLTIGLWPDPHTRQLALGGNDQVLSEWFLAYDARVYAGDFSLVTDRLNAPDGVNLLANASVILLGLLLGPVTLAFGAPVSFALAIGLNLAATAAAWYLLLARTVGTHRFAAAVGGLLAGFGPGMMSQANGHPHITAQWLVPALVWCVLRLSDPDRRHRTLTAALLGFLVTLQYHLGPEVLMITAIALLLFCAAYGAAAWPEARRRVGALGRGLGIAGGVAAVLLAYPLWLQFAGPQHVTGGPFSSYTFSLDAASVTTISPLALGGDRAAASLSTDPAEYNGFFGIPLLLAVAGITLWLWRRPVAVACAAAAAAMVVLALGPALTVDGEQTGVPLPFALVDGLPGVSAALPGRFALAAGPLFAVLIAIAIDTALALSTWARVIVPVAVLAALAPVAPTPLPTEERPAVPRYFTSGLWRGCAGDGGVLVPVPLPEPRRPESMRWAAAADAGFALPEGSFIGPYGEGGRASLGAFPRPTSLLLAQVADTGQVPAITDAQRADARADARLWRARCFVLAPQRNDAPLRETVERLLGSPPQRVADVDVWKLG
ncbi:hypothetical protein [Virgisporangium aurantiacum]|uniref:Glycosyl transferase n=1 Tax=Virgisporangium aurantiacum TaxID=175570 RepID=A0A8J4E1H4_9ACTN|nr:hypothetical protein [Virgisporangium aurantiacum]GIJ58810.1 glycosyl transferase [Virgisporangium aurantiacum]